MFRKLHTLVVDRVTEGAIVESIIDAYNAKIVDFRTDGEKETYFVKVSDKNWNKIEKALAVVRA